MGWTIVLIGLATFSLVFAQTTIDEYEQNIGALFKNVPSYEYPESHNDFAQDHFEYAGVYGVFDFIIVGGGSAGTVLANRLSEVNNWNILLVEAGQSESDYTDVPALAPLLQFTDYNWGYRSTVQNGSCLGMTDRKCNLPRGKALGGSSVINYMVYTRGNQLDYNTWAASGNPGWSYLEVLPYFLKSENSSLTEPVDELFHSKKGTLHVEHVKHYTEFAQAFLDGNVELGKDNLDYNGKYQMGYSKIQLNTINGRRWSANKAFLSSVRGRPNLVIQQGSYVTKLLINNHTKTIIGTEFVIGNKTYDAHVRREVILSAGTIGSAQLLMLSGIGPREHLQAVNIPVVQHLNVGQELGDHPFVLYPFSSNHTDEPKPLRTLIEEYIDGNGLFTAPGNIQVLGFEDTEHILSPLPNIEYLLSAFIGTNDGFLSKGVGFTPETLDALLKPFPGGTSFAMIILLHPKSRGTIKLKSNNPFDFPIIDPNFLSKTEDVEDLLLGFKYLFKVLNTTSMQKFNASVPNNPLPSCIHLTYLSDEYLRCAIRHLATTLYHPTGSCKMGSTLDENAVVDHNLNVRGVTGLRVVDASVIPFPLTAHPNAPVYMIAEKASDIIKTSHLL